MLQLAAPLAERAVGVDQSPAMLALARSRIDQSGLRNVQLRQGDIYAPPVERDAADLVIIHQVLHFLDDPARALSEAARALRPGGRLIVVDFAAHGEEYLREQFAHRRLGFATEEIEAFMREAGLQPVEARLAPPKRASSASLPSRCGSRAIRASCPTISRKPRRSGLKWRKIRFASPIGFARQRLLRILPPKTDEMEKTLWEAIARLAPLEPSFVSVTYGAGGSTRERTHATVARLVKETVSSPPRI